MGVWAAFFTLTGGAAASLLGLLFVAVSLGVSPGKRENREAVRHLAGQAFQNYLMTLIVSAVLLMPQLSYAIAGRIVFALMLSAMLWAGWRAWSTTRRVIGRTACIADIRRHLSALIGFGLALVAAAQLVFGGDSLHLLAASLLILLGAAVRTSWDLLLTLIEARDDV